MLPEVSIPPDSTPDSRGRVLRGVNGIEPMERLGLVSECAVNLSSWSSLRARLHLDYLRITSI